MVNPSERGIAQIGDFFESKAQTQQGAFVSLNRADLLREESSIDSAENALLVYLKKLASIQYIKGVGFSLIRQSGLYTHVVIEDLGREDRTATQAVHDSLGALEDLNRTLGVPISGSYVVIRGKEFKDVREEIKQTCSKDPDLDLIGIVGFN